MNTHYPIGIFTKPFNCSEKSFQFWLDEIRAFPQKLALQTSTLTTHELNFSYAKNSWSIREIVHHIADQHLHGYLCIKKALTKTHPLISYFDEKAFSKMPDYRYPIKNSLELIAIIHRHFYLLLKSLSPEQLKRTYEYMNGDIYSIQQSLAFYTWHGNHHLAQIRLALTSNRFVKY